MSMTYSIRISSFLLLLIYLSIVSCGPPSQEEYFELCPYELAIGSGAFYMQLDLQVSPQKAVYQVGDTINYKLDMTDSIYDQARQRHFTITNYPFVPQFVPYRIDVEGDAWYSAVRENEIIIDPSFQFNYDGETSDSALSLLGLSKYENGRYYYEFDFVLQTPGKYISMMFDDTNGLDQEDRERNPEFFGNITNDSGCPEPHYYEVRYAYDGDPRYETFAEEMRYLDEELYNGHIARLENGGPTDPIFGNGRTAAENISMFGFEVIE